MKKYETLSEEEENEIENYIKLIIHLQTPDEKISLGPQQKLLKDFVDEKVGSIRQLYFGFMNQSNIKQTVHELKKNFTPGKMLIAAKSSLGQGGHATALYRKNDGSFVFYDPNSRSGETEIKKNIDELPDELLRRLEIKSSYFIQYFIYDIEKKVTVTSNPLQDQKLKPLWREQPLQIGELTWSELALDQRGFPLWKNYAQASQYCESIGGRLPSQQEILNLNGNNLSKLFESQKGQMFNFWSSSLDNQDSSRRIAFAGLMPTHEKYLLSFKNSSTHGVFCVKK